MDVNILIKTVFRGNPRGKGQAHASIQYTAPSGTVHARYQEVSEESSTRNALDLEICIRALKILTKPCYVTIYIENEYVISVCQKKWLDKWHDNGWKNAKGKEPANIEMWKQLRMLMQIHNINFRVYEPDRRGRSE